MMSIGHGGAGAPTQLVGGAALGSVKAPKLLETKKAEPGEDKNMPTNDKTPIDWDTLISEKIDRFSQLLRSDVVALKLRRLIKKTGV